MCLLYPPPPPPPLIIGLRGFFFPLAQMGVLTPGSALARPFARPPSTPAEFFRRTCLQSHLQTSPSTPQKSYPKFRNPRKTFLKKPPFQLIVRGEGGVPKFCFGLESFYFCVLEAHAKLLNHTIFEFTPLVPQNM